MRENNPLVSIIVITYNSAKFVLETLESAKAQSYQNIELIVSDDFSTDNTVAICRNWIEQNKDRFVRTELITVEKNTGIAPNCNRGLGKANGIWLKLIAGDDLLINDCIENYVSYCYENNSCKILFGKMLQLNGGSITERKIPNFFKQKNQRNQEKLIYKGSGIQAPTLFIDKSFLQSLGGYDEKYKFIEDVPLWIKVAKSNEKFFFIDKFVVIYRIHGENICLPSNKYFINKLFYSDEEKLIINEILPYLFSKFDFLSCVNLLNYIFVNRLIILFGNKNNLLSKFIDLFNISKSTKRVCDYIFKKIKL